MNKEVSAPETGNWRNREIKNRGRNEGYNVISEDNQGKTHNWGKSIDTVFWKPNAPAENGSACCCCPQGSGGEEVMELLVIQVHQSNPSSVTLLTEGV